MTLRPYQLEAVEETEAGWDEWQRQLIVAGTGAGKTVIFSHLASRQPGRTLILAHREELINQAVMKLRAATGIFASVERAGSRAIPGHGVIVASVQTMRRRLAKYGPDAFDLIICDEAHHALSREWRTVLDYFTGCRRVLGVTATPDRADKKDLGRYFQRIAYEVGLLDLIGQGHLCGLRARQLGVEIDVGDLLKRRRDISTDEAAELIHPRLVALASAQAGETWDRKVLTFMPRCDVSARYAELLAGHGIDARHIEGGSPDRAEILRWFAEPGPKTLCNAMLLTEGFDQPDVDCISVLRMTTSRALYSQIIGRATRLFPGKEYALILDPLWLTGTHDLCRPACLTGGNQLHRELLQKQLDLGMDLLEAEAVAKVNAEAALVKQLEEAAKNRKAPRGLVDPLAFSIATHDTSLQEFEPTFEWESEAPTGEQMIQLADYGLWTEGMLRGYATALLAKVAARKAAGLASPKAVMKLKQLGEANADTATMAAAGRRMRMAFRR